MGSGSGFCSPTIGNGITIYVDWAYFLGIVGTLIGMAYYANGRFTQIETTVEWLEEILLEIKERHGTERNSHGMVSRLVPGSAGDGTFASIPLANDVSTPLAI
jgi:hypothetical protein